MSFSRSNVMPLVHLSIPGSVGVRPRFLQSTRRFIFHFVSKKMARGRFVTYWAASSPVAIYPCIFPSGIRISRPSLDPQVHQGLPQPPPGSLLNSTSKPYNISVVVQILRPRLACGRGFFFYRALPFSVNHWGSSVPSVARRSVKLPL